MILGSLGADPKGDLKSHPQVRRELPQHVNGVHDSYPKRKARKSGKPDASPRRCNRLGIFRQRPTWALNQRRQQDELPTMHQGAVQMTPVTE